MAGLKRFYAVFAAAFMLASCAATPPLAVAPSWVQQIEQQAIANGVTPQTAHAALDSFMPDPRVIALDQKQPETTITFAAYRRKTVTAARVKQGAALMRQYAAPLHSIEKRTGVPPQIVIALWGMESSFGSNMGDYQTVNALATLAYQGRRADFFRTELFAALHILDQEHIDASRLRGSWAGAMGQCQFMPTTYLKYAVDGDNDGRRDIWGDPADVMASIANYLAAEGWRGGETWGREVKADDVDDADTGLDKTRALAEWTADNVTGVDGAPLASSDQQAALIKPDGGDGDSFLVYDNFRALMRWNHSTYFASSVGVLADKIAAESTLDLSH